MMDENPYQSPREPANGGGFAAVWWFWLILALLALVLGGLWIEFPVIGD